MNSKQLFRSFSWKLQFHFLHIFLKIVQTKTLINHNFIIPHDKVSIYEFWSKSLQQKYFRSPLSNLCIVKNYLSTFSLNECFWELCITCLKLGIVAHQHALDSYSFTMIDLLLAKQLIPRANIYLDNDDDFSIDVSSFDESLLMLKYEIYSLLG